MSKYKQRKFIEGYAEGGVIRALKNRERAFEEAQKKAVTPAPTPIPPPMAPTLPAPEPNRVPVGPINQEVTKQALQVKQDADAATRSLGLRSFAEGGIVKRIAELHDYALPLSMVGVGAKAMLHSGPVGESPDNPVINALSAESSRRQLRQEYPDQVSRGLRGYADGDLIDPNYGAVQPRRDSSVPLTSEPGRVIPGMAAAHASRISGGTPSLVAMADQNRGYQPMARTALPQISMSTPAATPTPSPAPSNTTASTMATPEPPPVQRAAWAQGLGNLHTAAMPTVGESLPTQFGQASAGAINPKTGYPVMADGGQIWGGPETDNESTRIHSTIYKGPGGKWDGMPMYADGGNVTDSGPIRDPNALGGYRKQMPPTVTGFVKSPIRRDAGTTALSEAAAAGASTALNVGLRSNSPALARFGLRSLEGRPAVAIAGDFVPGAAGIVGAGRSLMQSPEYRQRFADSVGLGDSPLANTGADAWRTMANVGNAYTGGVAETIGRGAANYYQNHFGGPGKGLVPVPPRPGYANGGRVWNPSMGVHIPRGGSAVMTNRQTGQRITLQRPRFQDGGSVGMAPARGHKVGRKYGMKALLADGGPVNRANVKNGMIFGDGGPTEDKQPIMASPGEFVVPADTTRKIGAHNLRRMVDATHKPVHLNQGLRGGYANGTPDPLSAGMTPEELADFLAQNGGAAEEAPGVTARAADAVRGAARATSDTATRGWRGLRGWFRGKTPLTRPPGTDWTGLQNPPNYDPLDAATKARNPNYVWKNPGVAPEPIPAAGTGRPLPDAVPRVSPTAPPGANPLAGDLVTAAERAPGLGSRIAARTAGLARSGLGELLSTRGAVGAYALTKSKDLTEPQDAEHTAFEKERADSGLRITDEANQLSSREKSQLLSDINSGDPRKAELARLRMLGSNPQPFDPDYKAPGAYKSGLTNEQAKAYSDYAVGQAQGGAYDDQVSRGLRQAGIVSPSSPAVKPLPSRDTDATDLVAPEGGGYISGIDPDTKQRRLVSYTKDTMPQPMGVTDTTSPEIKAADLARRADWKAQSQAIDDKNAAAAAAESQGLNSLREQGQLAQSSYDRKQAVQAKDPQAYMDAMRTEDQVQRAQQFRGLQGAAQATQAGEMAKARMLAEAEKYRTDVGLRGTQYTADAGLLRAQMDNQRVADQARLAARGENLKTTEEYVNEGTKQYLPPDPKKPGASPQIDPVATAAMKNDWNRFRAGMVNNPDFLKKFPGVTSVNDIPREQIEPIFQQFMDSRALAQNVRTDSGDPALQGLPTKVDTRSLRLGDFVDMPWSKSRNSIGFGEGLWGWTNPVNPFVTPQEANILQIGTQGSPTHNVRVKDVQYTPTQKMEYLRMLKAQGKVQQAKDLQDIWQIP